MEKKIGKLKIQKSTLYYVIFLILFGIIFFSYNITLTWDSSEYIGLGDFIGTDSMKSKWIGHRGIMFPLLIRLTRPNGIANQFFMLILMYIFFIIMTYNIYKIYLKFKEEKVFDKYDTCIYFLWTFLFIIINPLIFGYFHTVLTEFVGLTVAIQIAFLCWKWLYLSWKDNKKEIILYCIYFSILTMFIYHIKQSLVPITLVPILFSSLISIIREWNLKNFLTRFLTFLVVVITLITSIIIWNFYMKEAKTQEDTENVRIKNRLIIGICELKKVCTNEDINEKILEDTNLKDLEISNEYEKYTIYKNSKNRYFIFYSNDDYSTKEQIKFYFEVLFKSPGDVIKSYRYNYWKEMFINENRKLTRAEENAVIPIITYLGKYNAQEPNPEFIDFTMQYLIVNKGNPIKNMFNVTVRLRYFMNAFTKITLYIQPLLLLVLFIIYLITRKKINKSNIKLLEFICILYAQSFGIIMAYVVFGQIIDRYFIPATISNYIADVLLIIFIKKLFEENKMQKNLIKVNK